MTHRAGRPGAGRIPARTDDVIEIAAAYPDDDGTPVRPVTMPRGQCLLYGLTRWHLAALAHSVPATNPVDYWTALGALDAFYDPLIRPAADPPLVVGKRVHYVTALMAIETLAESYLPNPRRGRSRRRAP